MPAFPLQVLLRLRIPMPRLVLVRGSVVTVLVPADSPIPTPVMGFTGGIGVGGGHPPR